MSLAMASFDVRVEMGVDERLRADARGVQDLPCRTYDPDLWFSDSPADLEVAKSLCVQCPLRAEAGRVANPKGPAYQLGRQLNLPPAYLLVHRVTLGSIGVLCQLEAEAPYRAIVEEWLPGFREAAQVPPKKRAKKAK